MISLPVLASAALGGTASAQDQLPFDARSKELFVESVDPAERDYLVDVGSRWILPGLRKPIEFVADWSTVYVQFRSGLSAEQRGALTRAGVRFYGAISGNTYLAHIRSRSLAALRSHPEIRGIEPVLPADKLTARLYGGTPSPHALLPDGSSRVLVYFYEDVRLEHALQVLDRWGVVVPDRSELRIGNKLPVIATHGQVLVLAEEAAVRWIFEAPPPPKADNLTAAALSNIDHLQDPPYGLTGDGVRIGQWEGHNPLATHGDLTGRVTIIQDAGPGDHATHVAGTMIGDGTGDPNALGMAPGARLWSYDWDGDVADEQTDAEDDEGVDITNHSWGFIAGWDDGVDTGNDDLFGLYDSVARDWDEMVLDSGLEVQKSSGNDRNDCDPGDPNDCDGVLGPDGERYDTIVSFGVAKNIITVGAVDDFLNIASFSSSGPANDGRIKPDVVANGVDLYSTWAQGVTLGSCGVGTDYCSIGGTSMSTPTTTGAIALLTELYRDLYGGLNPTTRAIRALLVNTAVDLGRPGPDYLYGHGLVDAFAAAQIIEIGDVRIVQDAVDDGETDVWYIGVGHHWPELRITGAWVDPAGEPDSDTKDLINDLDVQVFDPNGVQYFPFRLQGGDPTANALADASNTRDNVEHVRVANPDPGIWEVRVRGTEVPDGPQAYALVADVEFFLQDEPNIEVSADLSFPETCVGDSMERSVQIFNTGGAPLFVHDVVVSDGLPDFTVVPWPSPPFILQPGSHIELYVQYAPFSDGVHTGTLTILSNDADEGEFDVPMVGVAGYQDVAALIESKGYFGRVAVGDLENLDLQVLNQGICPLEVINLSPVMGTADFAVGEIDGYPGFPFTLFPGEAAVIAIRYLPMDFGEDVGLYRLVTDDPDTPEIDVPVRGTAPPPMIEVSGSLDFGEVCPGENPEKVLDVCNTGLSDLIVSSVSLNADCDDFVIVNNPFPATVSHDFCLSVTVRYTPTGVGDHMCTLTIESNDPDTPTLELPVTGTLLPVSLDVSPDLTFPPTVIQPVDMDCESLLPFPVTNNGECPITITAFDIVQPGIDYSPVNLPGLPITLLPGEQLGDGILMIRFAPYMVGRFSTAQVLVTYESNAPMIGDTETITRDLCGEGVNTGARLLVTEEGVPMPLVHKIKLFRVYWPDTVDEELGIISINVEVPLKVVGSEPPCPSFVYHLEWGGETNPIVLEPGTYEALAEHPFYDGTKIYTERFVIPDDCTFVDDVVINFLHF